MEEKICQIAWFSGKLSRFGMQICRNRGLFLLMCTGPYGDTPIYLPSFDRTGMLYSSVSSVSFLLNSVLISPRNWFHLLQICPVIIAMSVMFPTSLIFLSFLIKLHNLVYKSRYVPRMRL